MAPTDPSAAAARATPADVPPHPPAEPLLRDAPLAVLIGPMAAGKSSVGRALAKLLGASFDFAALTEVDEAVREEILEELETSTVAEGVRDLDSDDAITILESLPEEEQA